ncbi:nucleotide-diphospho-sugar transferase, partial [Ascodesmis nigricans]
KNAYLTLLTRGSYLPGVIILAHSLRKVGTRYPLIVAVTPSLPKACVDVLVAEGLRVEVVAAIVPVWATEKEGGKDGKRNRGAMVADRFEDTWTKLVAFSHDDDDNDGATTIPMIPRRSMIPLTSPLQRILLLDADLLLLHPLDPLFTLPLPSTHIAATPACICNLDSQPWAPIFWTPSNCAFTHYPPSPHPLSHHPHHPPPPLTPLPPPPTPTLNSGLLLLHPSLPLFSSLLTTIHTSPLSPTLQFPDQDLLSDVFRGKWWPLGWMWNAVKTMRYWHPGVWRDGSVRVVHYIVEKPWEVRRGEEGEDAVTVGWWWREWE